MGQPSVCHLSSPFDGAAGDGDVGSAAWEPWNSQELQLQNIDVTNSIG